VDADLQGKIALITGGASGIGLGIAHALAAEGANLAIVGRDGGDEALASLRATGVRVHYIRADVARERDVVNMVSETISELGGLDLYVNNAARAIHQPLLEINAETFRTILDTNLAACLWACREVARHFISHGIHGAMLVVGSTSMYTPGPTETVYRLTKVGLKALVQSLAVELAPHGIRINLLVPGHYRTRLTQNIPAETEDKLKQQIPLRRFGDTSDCGHAAVYLLSPLLARYVTGAELLVDGGLALRPMHFLSDAELHGLNAPP